MYCIFFTGPPIFFKPISNKWFQNYKLLWCTIKVVFYRLDCTYVQKERGKTELLILHLYIILTGNPETTSHTQLFFRNYCGLALVFIVKPCMLSISFLRTAVTILCWATIGLPWGKTVRLWRSFAFVKYTTYRKQRTLDVDIVHGAAAPWNILNNHFRRRQLLH